MFTIFNGRQRQPDASQPRIFAQLDVTLREHIADFKQQNSLNPFAVFMAIALHSNENGWAWPKTETLKSETGLTSDRAIYAIISFLRGMKLEGKRVLDQYRVFENGKWGDTFYHILPEAGGADKLPDKRLKLWGKQTKYYAKKSKMPPVGVPHMEKPPVGVLHIGVPQDSYKNNHVEGDSSPSFEDKSSHDGGGDVSLNPAEREILRACNDGVVIAHYHNAEAANRLIELGLIDRCQCGAKEVLCLKGKCPTHDKPCPDDVKVTELQTALQQSFLPGSNGNEPEKAVTPSPQTPPNDPLGLPKLKRYQVEGVQHWPDGQDTPFTEDERYDKFLGARLHAMVVKRGLENADVYVRDMETSLIVWPERPVAADTPPEVHEVKLVPPAPAALPEVPFKPGDLVWWIPAENQRNLCGTQPRVAAVVAQVTAKRVHIATEKDGAPYVKPENLRHSEYSDPSSIRDWELQAIAAARAQGKGKGAKKGKPALRQPDKEIKDYLATLMFGGTDIVGGSWALVVKAWNAVDCPELAKVKRFGAWWPNHWPGNKGEKPSLALIKTHWDTAMNDTIKEAADDAYYAKMDTDDGWMFDNVGKEQP